MDSADIRRWCAPATAASPRRGLPIHRPAARRGRHPAAADRRGARLDDKARDIGYSEAELAAVPEGANLGLGCGNPAGHRGDAARRDGGRSRQRRRLRLPPGGAAGRPEGPRDRRRYDARDAEQGARQRRQGRRRAMSSSAWARLEHLPIADDTGRRDHLELRDQSGARQGAGVPRGLPRAEAGRPAGDLRCRQHRAAAAGICAPIRRCCAAASPAPSPRDRSKPGCARRGSSMSRISVKPESRDLVASWAPGRGIENYVASRHGRGHASRAQARRMHAARRRAAS